MRRSLSGIGTCSSSSRRIRSATESTWSNLIVTDDATGTHKVSYVERQTVITQEVLSGESSLGDLAVRGRRRASGLQRRCR